MLMYKEPPHNQKEPAGNQPAPSGRDIEMQDGYLRVRVVSASTEEPLARATVMIYSEEHGEPETQKVLTTGADGNTEKIALSAPAKEYSLLATSVIVPYSRYTIRVEYPGYYTNIYKNAQVFAATTTIQESSMDPLPFGVKNAPGMEKVYTIPETVPGLRETSFQYL
jgi:hypothetical protein